MIVSTATVLRKLLDKPGLLFRPCAYDALSAVLIEKAGFEVVGTTGYGISASLIGQPDLGLIDFTRMLDRAQSIINAVSIPVDVDVDTGYGNALNVYWTVKNFVRIGAAGIRIEDQVWPKRCGHMEGKQLVPKEEMIQKINSAIKAREEEHSELVVGARTDARTVAGLEETIERAVAYAEAGGDYIYVEAPQSLEEVEALVKRVSAPLAFNIIPGGKTPLFRVEDLESRGVKYLSIPMICLYPATKAMIDALKSFRESRDLEKLASIGVSWAEFNDIIGLKKWRQLELEVSSEEALLKRYGTKNPVSS